MKGGQELIAELRRELAEAQRCECEDEECLEVANRSVHHLDTLTVELAEARRDTERLEHLMKWYSWAPLPEGRDGLDDDIKRLAARGSSRYGASPRPHGRRARQILDESPAMEQWAWELIAELRRELAEARKDSERLIELVADMVKKYDGDEWLDSEFNDALAKVRAAIDAARGRS